IPFKDGRQHDDLGVPFHDGEVDRLALNGSKVFAEDGVKVRRVRAGDDGFNPLHDLRFILAQRSQDRLRSPYKDARVPVEVTGFEVLTGDVERRFFAKPRDAVRLAVGTGFPEQFTTLDIPVAGRRIGGWDAERDERLWMALDDGHGV